MSIDLICTTAGVQSSFGMPAYGHISLPTPLFATTGEWSTAKRDVQGHVAGADATRNGRGSHAWRPLTV